MKLQDLPSSALGSIFVGWYDTLEGLSLMSLPLVIIDAALLVIDGALPDPSRRGLSSPTVPPVPRNLLPSGWVPVPEPLVLPG